MRADAGSSDEVLLDRIDDARRLVDRADAGMRLAGVASPSLNVDTVIIESLVGSYGRHGRWLGNDHHIRLWAVRDDVQRAEAGGVLLRDHAGEDEIALEPDPCPLQRDHGRELAGNSTLHVDRAAAGELAVD